MFLLNITQPNLTYRKIFKSFLNLGEGCFARLDTLGETTSNQSTVYARFSLNNPEFGRKIYFLKTYL